MDRKCPKCHRETYSKKWGTCTAQDCSLAINTPDIAINNRPAINEERLTDAINRDHSERVVEAVPPGDGEGAGRGGDERRGLAASRAPNRRSRESYNAYMKGYMARRRKEPVRKTPPKVDEAS